MKLLKIWDVRQKGKSKVRTICGTILAAVVAMEKIFLIALSVLPFAVSAAQEVRDVVDFK